MLIFAFHGGKPQTKRGALRPLEHTPSLYDYSKNGGMEKEIGRKGSNQHKLIFTAGWM